MSVKCKRICGEIDSYFLYVQQKKIVNTIPKVENGVFKFILVISGDLKYNQWSWQMAKGTGGFWSSSSH